ncbi:uncharacterized protein LOC127004125 [Eriocheir sinensis]|uniref:uncharacterized protein LOC127004125 n=1 Tax=Eriocheir sinensis TaxID=95602 RepID=UPI0021C59364|nr:uncharacterized protein LOC127004125 [Eriocheir sinensis]XP_050727469.1 uncharacterized protein LOC127004125 [Eriocheir sinensis]
MLASRGRGHSGRTEERKQSVCCGGSEECLDGQRSLEGRAVGVVAALVEGSVNAPKESQSLCALASYLLPLNSRLLTAVMTAVMAGRPRWLPLEYHWAPLDHDPLLGLLQLVGMRLTAFTYTCHPLSREPLLQALAAMPVLVFLSLPKTADNDVLALVGATCHTLATLCVRGSKGVTDDGVRRLILRRHTFTRSRWRRLFTHWRVLRASLTRQQACYRPLPPAVINDQALLPPLDPDHLNPLSATLTHLDLGGTRVTLQTAEWARGLLSSQACVEVTSATQRAMNPQDSLEDQMVGLLAPLTP